MPPYQNCTYFRETGRAVSMKPPMPRQVLQLPLLTKSSHGADSVLTGGWDTTSAMENKNGNKERRTRIEIAIGLTVVALLYLIDWLSR